MTARNSEAERMAVISLWQPFASLIFTWDEDRGDFAKCNETRGFRIPERLIGKPVAIHATANFPASRCISPELNDLCYDLYGCGYNYSLPLGAIIGVVQFGVPRQIDERFEHQCETEIAAGDWRDGRWAWPIVSARALASPVTAKGKQGWWSYPAAALQSQSEQNPAAAPLPGEKEAAGE